MSCVYNYVNSNFAVIIIYADSVVFGHLTKVKAYTRIIYSINQVYRGVL
jgi:hypothetical protein